MKVTDLINVLNEYAPFAYQESYDNSQLIVGLPQSEVKGVLISLDCTEDVVKEAVLKGCNVIVAHHPIVFKGLKTISNENYIQRTVYSAIKQDVCLIALHTNLDNVCNGVNDVIAKKLNLTNTSVLKPKANTLKKLVTYCPAQNADEIKDALFEAGAGSIGNYSECSFNTNGLGTFKPNANASPFIGETNQRHIEPEMKIELVFASHLQGKIISSLLSVHPYEEIAYDIFSLENNNKYVGAGMIGELKEPIKTIDFLKQIKTAFNCKVIKHTNLLTDTIKKVAVCGGAGFFLLPNAIKSKADIFITSDIKYHEFFDADNQIILADVGHYESEQFTSGLIKEVLMQKIPTFAVHLSETNTNPVKYLV